MGKELELYQQEIDKAYKPLLSRLEHYKKSVNQIRSLLNSYFFNTTRTDSLLESSSTGGVLFDFNAVKKAMTLCLLDEKRLENVNGIVIEFDKQIATSELPLELQEDRCLYLFKPNTPYTPLAQTFMEQFAYALSAYRVCLGVYEVYAALAYYKTQQAEALKTYMEVITNVQQSTKNLKLQGAEDDLTVLLKQANDIQEDLGSKLRTEKVHEGMDAFKDNIKDCSGALTSSLNTIALHLQNCYKIFPNDAKLWMFHDRTWHWLLKSLAMHLYANQYTYSTMQSSLHIKKEFVDCVQTEIDNFVSVLTKKTPLLKIALLKEAAKSISDTKIEILASMAETGITVVEVPKISHFSKAKSENFYQRLFDNKISTEDDEYTSPNLHGV